MSEILAREWLDEVQAWTPPDVRRSAAPKPMPSRHPTIQSARELERLQKLAWDEAYAAGRKAGEEQGLAAGREEVRRQVQALKAVLDRLAAPLEHSESELERELTELALAIAREVIGREVKTAPDFILQLVPRAVKALPAYGSPPRVRLHPADAALVSEHLPSGDGETSWSIVEDPSISRGGCQVESPSSSADATLEKRLAAVVARLFEDHANESVSTEAPDQP